MITKNDCILILSEMNETDKIKELLTQSMPSLELLQYINDKREFELTQFYHKIRKSYNNKKSKLYINIVKEIEDPTEVLTTLSALLTQILIFSKDVPNKATFMRQARCLEISTVIREYFNTYDITQCLKLLKIIKADIKICDYLDRSSKSLEK